MARTRSASDPDVELLQTLGEARSRLEMELHRAVVGQRDVVQQVMIALLAGGHCLLMGVPGLGKTLLVRTLARLFHMDFNRVQLTPDLMPSDITGTEILQLDEDGRRHFEFREGPVFTNLLLADEINRTPPRTQSALLEAMQEHAITAFGRRHDLPRPFHVFATQNPIEQEGTYRLPEAQLDRFLFTIRLEYPTEEEEAGIAARRDFYEVELDENLMGAERLLAYQALVDRIVAAEPMVRHAVRIVNQSRPERSRLDRVRRHVTWGAGPRASQAIVAAARAWAALNGRGGVDRSDIEFVARPVLRHRITLSYAAMADQVDMEELIEEIISSASQAGPSQAR